MHHTTVMLSNAHMQIFEFLDVDGLGSIDLVATISASPDWLDDLDDEVRETAPVLEAVTDKAGQWLGSPWLLT
jgi:hypothetical protein